jgi:predicted nucleic acid-binding protein
LATSYLLDTNIITALAHGNATALAHLSALGPNDEVCSCFIVLGEWEYGIRNATGARQQAQIRAIGTPLFAALTAIWDSTPAIALRYGALHASLRASGQIIPTNDLWIAAVALENGASIVTTDPHFQRVPGLKVVDWTQP